MTLYFSGFFNKPTHSKPKDSDAVPAVRPGDSQGGGFAGSAPWVGFFSRFLPRQEPCPRRDRHWNIHGG